VDAVENGGGRGVVSIRLSFDERARVQAAADRLGESLGLYMRSAVLAAADVVPSVYAGALSTDASANACAACGALNGLHRKGCRR